MTSIKTRIRVGIDGTLSGRASGLPAGEHEAEIVLIDPPMRSSRHTFQQLLSRVRQIQAEVARLPVLDARRPDEILGYNENGHFG